MQQTPTIQAAVKTLVANKQLEFVNGGWCMYVACSVQFSLHGEVLAPFSFGCEAGTMKPPRIMWT
jgi:hypothetical protein